MYKKQHQEVLTQYYLLIRKNTTITSILVKYIFLKCTFNIVQSFLVSWVEFTLQARVELRSRFRLRGDEDDLEILPFRNHLGLVEDNVGVIVGLKGYMVHRSPVVKINPKKKFHKKEKILLTFYENKHFLLIFNFNFFLILIFNFFHHKLMFPY